MIFKGKAVSPWTVEHVHDPKSGKYIAEFHEGTFETEDKEVIERLKDLGYEAISESEKPKEKVKK
jgi:hypothetical protein